MIGFRGCSVANPEPPLPPQFFLSYIASFHSLVALTWRPTSLDLISNMIRSEGAAAATKHIAPPSPLVAFAVRHFRQETCDMGYEGYDYDLGFFLWPLLLLVTSAELASILSRPGTVYRYPRYALLGISDALFFLSDPLFVHIQLYTFEYLCVFMDYIDRSVYLFFLP